MTRALVAVAGLPMGASQPLGNYEGGASNDDWIWWISATSALVVFGVLMSTARSNAGRGSDEPPNDQGALMPSDDSDSQNSTSDEELRS